MKNYSRKCILQFYTSLPQLTDLLKTRIKLVFTVAKTGYRSKLREHSGNISEISASGSFTGKQTESIFLASFEIVNNHCHSCVHLQWGVLLWNHWGRSHIPGQLILTPSKTKITNERNKKLSSVPPVTYCNTRSMWHCEFYPLENVAGSYLCASSLWWGRAPFHFCRG